MSSASGRDRQPKRALTDEDSITFALERFEPLSRNEALKEIAAIAKDHGRAASVVSNAIKRSFARKLVGIVRLKHPGPTRLPQLEQRLLQKFPKLHIVRVIKALEGRTSSATERALSEDKTHGELGRAIATLVADNSIVRDNDIIGIGSGRGVYSVLKALTFFEQLRARNVTAVSLTGDVYPRSHASWIPDINERTPGLNLQLDADDHLNILGLSFPPDLKIVKISSLIAWERGQLTAARRRTILDQDEWKKNVPDLAIVGVGVFSHGHRFYQEVNAPAIECESRLKPILGDLRSLANRLKEVVEASQAERYVPVGDMCNRLFYVKPPSGVSISSERESQIKDLIRSINEKLLTASDEQLAQIGQLILVAGTLKKAPAIKQLLEEDKYNIRIICVDEEAAAAILGS
jgi:hypothetical protein